MIELRKPEQSDAALTASYEHLRKNARYTSDIVVWLKNNPNALIGQSKLHPNTSLDIELSRFKIDLMQVHKTKGLLIDFTVKGFTPFDPPSFLTHRLKPDTQAKGLSFEFDVELLFSLHDWPLATAIIAGYYIERVSDCIRPAFIATEALLEEVVPMHFPSFTFDKLYAVAKADLLSVTGESELSTWDVVRFLFMTLDAAKSSSTIPDNLA